MLKVDLETTLMLQSAFKNLKFLTIGRSAIYNQTLKTHTVAELKKDLFGRGDLTCKLLGKQQNKIIQAQIKAKASGIIAGLEETQWFLKKNKIKTQSTKKEGEQIQAGEIVLTLTGKAKAILETERVALNLLQRMSGIATLTFQAKQKLPKEIMLAATRKTLWGLLDKKAVVSGGGVAHRLGLWHAVLIKENHLKLETAEKLLQQAWFADKKGAFIDIEAETKTQAVSFARIVKELRKQKPQKIPIIIMLDNFEIQEIEATAREIKLIDPEIFIEISGGITPTNLIDYGKLQGIDLISSGFLTHSVVALDLSLKVI